MKINSKHIKFWIKCNHLKLITAIACIAFGIIIGVLLCKNVETKYDWLIGILTGLMTSMVVSVFLDCFNKAAQKRKMTQLSGLQFLDFGIT